jgi:hypothetical protein
VITKELNSLADSFLGCPSPVPSWQVLTLDVDEMALNDPS